MQATGRGAHVVAALAGYSFGNIEDVLYSNDNDYKSAYPDNFAKPLEVLLGFSLNTT